MLVEREQPLDVDRLADRLFRQSTFVVVSFVCLVAVLRTGITEYRQPLQLEIAAAFPTPVTSYRGGAIVSPALASLLGVDTLSSWFVLHMAATGVLFAVLVFLVWRQFATVEQRLFVFVVVMASGLPVTALVRIGHYDVWLHIGALVLVLSRSYYAAAFGGLLMGLTNVEQTAVAIVTLFCVAALVDRSHLKRTVAAGVGLVVAWASIRGWYLAYGVETENRATFLGESLTRSLRGFGRSAPVQVYSWFSAAWIAVASIVGRPMVLVALVGFPALSAVTTVDGTRVFVACVLPAFLFLVTVAADRWNAAQLRKLTAVSLVVMCVTPGLSTFVDGWIITPWQDAFY